MKTERVPEHPFELGYVLFKHHPMLGGEPDLWPSRLVPEVESKFARLIECERLAGDQARHILNAVCQCVQNFNDNEAMRVSNNKAYAGMAAAGHSLYQKLEHLEPDKRTHLIAGWSLEASSIVEAQRFMVMLDELISRANGDDGTFVRRRKGGNPPDTHIRVLCREAADAFRILCNRTTPSGEFLELLHSVLPKRCQLSADSENGNIPKLLLKQLYIDRKQQQALRDRQEQRRRQPKGDGN